MYIYACIYIHTPPVAFLFPFEKPSTVSAEPGDKSRVPTREIKEIAAISPWRIRDRRSIVRTPGQ